MNNFGYGILTDNISKYCSFVRSQIGTGRAFNAWGCFTSGFVDERLQPCPKNNKW